MGRTAGQRPGPPRSLELPALASLDDGPAPHGDYEAALILERDLGATDATGAAFQGTRIERCRLDDATLADTRFTECLLVELGASGLDAGGSTWRDVILDRPRIGALAAVRAQWSSVRVRGGRIDFLVLAGARLDDVAFEDCSIGELDLGDARLRNVTFERCQVGVLDVESAFLVDVDLSGAVLATVRGVGSLRGATVSTSQLIEMASLLADHLGIHVRDTRPADG